MPLEISAIIPTRGDVDQSAIRANLRKYPEVKEIIFAVGATVFNRYVAAKGAQFPVILTQDDDCIADMRPVIDNYIPGIIVNAMTRQHALGYQGRQTLLGFGAVFDRSLVAVLDGWERDDLFLREADRVFTSLVPHVSVFDEIEILPCAYTADRLYRQPEHGQSHVAINRRIEEARVYE